MSAHASWCQDLEHDADGFCTGARCTIAGRGAGVGHGAEEVVVQRYLDCATGKQSVAITGDAFLTPVDARQLATVLRTLADAIDTLSV